MGEVALVTNRHLVDLDFSDLDFSRSDAKYKDFALSGIEVTGRHPDDSIYQFAIDTQCQPCFSANIDEDVAVFLRPRCYPIRNMDSNNLYYHFGQEDIADEDYFSNELRAFDEVAFTGFPEYYDVLSERPIIRSGRIASDPKHNYPINGRAAGRCIAYEAFSHEGASGSPVYAPAKGLSSIPTSRDGRLVGINAGHIKTNHGQHSGLSYFYRSSVILEIIRDHAERSTWSS